MKITPPPTINTGFAKVSEKQDHGGTSQQKDQRQNPDDSKKEKEVHVDSNLQSVAHAIEEFSADKHAQANGLSAAMVGAGPGLKVVLKDGSGAIIRQLSGEEFLKLRETVTKDSSKRGKILDQKL